ncbi:Fur family transcriptional regulator [Mucilaginibacter terrae]|uniref:Fur family ferric uptake transcriptional regulator n=1 Tax=Mucilaginibacter terrae TaxID=1955052 RepID=A0ABU3GRA4_9SPHI|nr:transcriptional repressor [Mucilaginibacter terrae]MDT3402086.1 Fur family ferric uptake transcriptional regulator [Mucilaginibacter terrae]
MENKFAGILSKHELKVTQARLLVLGIISKAKSAVSQPQIENHLNGKVDRVTLYRILSAFEQKGILHKVIDLNGTANYAMCSSKCTKHAHHDKHFHFNCTQCFKVYCMNDFSLPPVQLPAGFAAQDINLTITGVCKECNA